MPRASESDSESESERERERKVKCVVYRGGRQALHRARHVCISSFYVASTST